MEKPEIALAGADPVAQQKRSWSRKPRKVGVVFDHGRVEIFKSINSAARYLDVAPESLQQALDEQRTCYSMEVFYVYRESSERPETSDATAHDASRVNQAHEP